MATPNSCANARAVAELAVAAPGGYAAIEQMRALSARAAADARLIAIALCRLIDQVEAGASKDDIAAQLRVLADEVDGAADHDD